MAGGDGKGTVCQRKPSRNGTSRGCSWCQLPPGTACSRGPATAMLGPVPGSATGASAEGSVPANPGNWVPGWARQLL